MSDSSKSGGFGSISAIVALAKADLSKTTALYFAPVTAVVNEVAKAVRGTLNQNSLEQSSTKQAGGRLYKDS